MQFILFMAQWPSLSIARGLKTAINIRKQTIACILMCILLFFAAVTSHGQNLQNLPLKDTFNTGSNTEVAYDQVSVSGTRTIQFDINTEVEKGRAADKKVALTLPEVAGMRYDLSKARGLHFGSGPGVFMSFNQTNKYRVLIPLMDGSGKDGQLKRISIDIF